MIESANTEEHRADPAFKTRSKRILIVSADTGGGHRSAMRAVAAGLRAEFGERVEVAMAPRVIERTHAVNRLFCDLYNAMLRHRPGWVGTYAAALERLRPNEREALYAAFVRRSLVPLLARAAPDLVVSVHPMANHHLARALAEAFGPAAPPLATIVTDPVGGFWPAWACAEASLVVTATEAAARLVREIAARRGFPADFAGRVRAIGLPVDASFEAPPRRAPAATLEALGLEAGRPALLATAGWAGEPPSVFLDAVAAFRTADDHSQVIAVCGNSRALLDAARRRFRHDPRVAPIGFATDMADLLAAADAIFTKPGGLTVHEAIARGVPILVNRLRPLMPQEAPTAAWIAAEGLGLEVSSLAEVPRAAAFLRDEVARARTRLALRRAARPHAARDIARALGALVGLAAEPAVARASAHG